MATPSTRPPAFLSQREYAEEIRVSVKTVMRMIDRGDLAVVKIGGSVRIPWSEVDRFLDAAAPRPRSTEDDK